ncbi:MAG: dihydrodipicolinate synthase family protein [Bacteroidales bacterium]|nr:dihydrodipicolinate synthase family protein [Bacteroidales bacterium]
MIDLHGIFPPLPTSFNKDESLSTEHIRKNIETLNRYGLSGYLILGSNGELVMLSHEEKIRVMEAAREAIPREKLMLAGTGCESTRETILLSREAARAGADAVMVLNPFYYKGQMSQAALVSHYHTVADASAVPVIIYNMPANTGLDMTAADISAIADHPNIIGLKDSGGNLAKMAGIIHNTKKGFQVLAGSAGFLLPALTIGAVGGILALANIAPQNCLDIYHSFVEGKMDRAQKLQQEIVSLNAAVTRNWGVPALKAAMDHLGMYGGPCRRPLQPISEEVKKKLLQLL